MTLRITVQEGPEVTTLKLEGRVMGANTEEFERAWESLANSLGPKKLRVDLCGVTHMDADGRRVLAEIHKQTNADFLADTPMNKYFIQEARLKSGRDFKEGV